MANSSVYSRLSGFGRIGAALLATAAVPYLVYPLLLRLLPRRARLSRQKPRSSVLLLTIFHDEARHIEEKAAELRAIAAGREATGVLLVSDGSNDGSEQLAGEALILPRMGKTAALRRALGTPEARAAEIILLSDANVSVTPELVEAMIAEFDEETGVVAAPLLPAADGPERLYWRFENSLRHAEAERISAVGAAGACWAVRRDLVERVDFEGMLCEDLWIPLAIRAVGYRIGCADGPPAIESDSGAESIEIARRSRIMAGNLQVLSRWHEIRDGLPPIDRALFHGHKTMRWLGAFFIPAGIAALAFDQARRNGFVRTAAAVVPLLLCRPVRYFLLMQFGLLSGLVRRFPDGAWESERHA